MPRELINVGSEANDGTGETLRAAGQKINNNFAEVYGILEENGSELTGNSAAIAALATNTQAELALKAPLTQTQGVIAYASAVTLDLAALNGTAQTIRLSGPLTLAATGLAAGRSVVLRLINDEAEITLSFPSEWSFVGAKPTVIAAGFVGRLRLDFWGDSPLDCVADWRSGAIPVSMTLDSDAANYIAAVQTADGAGLEPDIVQAYNAFVVGCKLDGIWDAIKSSCILGGARTLAGALVPLKGTAPTNVGFVSGDYSRTLGLRKSGTKELNSNRSNNTDPQNSKHVSVYVTESSTVQNMSYLGTIYTSVGFTSLNTFSASAVNVSLHNGSGAVSSANVLGFIGADRSNSSEISVRSAGITAISAHASQTPSNINIFVLTGLAGTAQATFYSIGESINLALLDARLIALNNAIVAALP